MKIIASWSGMPSSWTWPPPPRRTCSPSGRAPAKSVPALDADRLLDVLIEREGLQSTGIGEGVAIPHGKMAGLDSLVASFARGRAWIRNRGQATQLFFLLVVPEHSGVST